MVLVLINRKWYYWIYHQETTLNNWNFKAHKKFTKFHMGNQS